jgi:hypothetical protein
MKRTIVAIALSALTIPALAADLPYEQINVDRALPNIPQRATKNDERSSTTFEQYNPV